LDKTSIFIEQVGAASPIISNFIQKFIKSLTQLKRMIEELLQEELDSYLGYSKYGYEHKNTENFRN